MANNQNLSRIRANEHQVYLNTGKLLGVEDISINSNFGTNALNYLGLSTTRSFQIASSEQYAELTLNSNLINSDSLIPLIDPAPFNVYILKSQSNLDSNKNFYLISGYLNSYTASYKLGQIPKITTSLKFYRDAGAIPLASLSAQPVSQLSGITSNNYSSLNSGYSIPSYGSIDLTLNEYTTNRVLDFNIQIDVNRIPVYNVGSKFPRRVDTIKPIKVNCSFTFEVGNYSATQLRNLIGSPQTQNILLTVKDFQNDSEMGSYTLSDMTLVNEVFGTTVDGNETVTKQFFGFTPGFEAISQNSSLSSDAFTRVTVDNLIRVSEDGYNRTIE